MKAYVLINSNRGYCGVFSSEEKAVEAAIDRYSHTFNRPASKRKATFSGAKKSDSGKYIKVYFRLQTKGHEDEEWNPYTILIRNLA